MKTTKFKPIEKMTTVIRGTFGRFKTDKSYPVNYILSSLPIENLKLLTTASELFSIDNIQFEELIQRDIDSSRVQSIANDYLAKSEKKVVFFPPLLACVVVLDENGKIKKQYETHEEEIEEETILKSTWDKNAFEVSLIISEPGESDRIYQSKEHGNIEYSDFGAQLRINPKKVKLVVLDGQHRLSALRLIRGGSNSHILDEIELPICIMFSPSADKSLSQQDMVNDFRELFVRVNVEQRKVSGHFIILLQDDSFSAMTVREYADFLKKPDATGFSALHLIEWNQRIDELTKKRTRNSSLTTIGIIYDTLQNHLFNAELGGALLNLPETLEVGEDIFYLTEITDKTLGNDTADAIVKEAIREILVPSLNLLLRKPTPYKAAEETIRKAFKKLDSYEEEHHTGFTSLKKDYIEKYIYRSEEISETKTKNCLAELQDWIDVEAYETPYLLHAFQQGLIRTWISISLLLKNHSINPKETAAALVEALDKLVFNSKKSYLANSRLYTRRVLWKNERVNFSSGWSREAWYQAIAMSLLNKNARSALIQSLSEKHPSISQAKSNLSEEIAAHAKLCFEAYRDRLSEELYKDTKANLVDIVSSESFMLLQSMQHSKDPAVRKEFEAKVRSLSGDKLEEAITELANILSIDKSTLLP